MAAAPRRLSGACWALVVFVAVVAAMAVTICGVVWLAQGLLWLVAQ